MSRHLSRTQSICPSQALNSLIRTCLYAGRRAAKLKSTLAPSYPEMVGESTDRRPREAFAAQGLRFFEEIRRQVLEKVTESDDLQSQGRRAGYLTVMLRAVEELDRQELGVTGPQCGP